jgi:hypothetical protein
MPTSNTAPLEPFREGIWSTRRRARFFGVETGTRMTIVRLSDGGLFVHSPVALDPATKAEVDALGPVRAVVAPSLFHHLHVGPWIEAYPDAVVSPCPGLELKRPDLGWTRVLGDGPDPVWAEDLDQVYFSSRRENEVDFFHRASRTFLCADALLNLSTHELPSTRLVARIMGNVAPGVGWMEPLMVRDRRVARRQVDRMLAWDIDGILLAHGAAVEHDGRAALERAYAWL